MAKRDHWRPLPADLESDLEERVAALYPDVLAKLPNDQSPAVYSSYENGVFKATVTFYFPESSASSHFEHRNGVWQMTRDWND